MSLAPDYDVHEVAAAVGMSSKWIYKQVKAGAEHNRYGRKIRFTSEQVDMLRARHTKSAVPSKQVTTGRKRGR